MITMSISKIIDKIKKYENFYGNYTDYIIISLINISIIFVSLIVSYNHNYLYIIPYRDMLLGFYPKSFYFKALRSTITPEGFGVVSNYNIGYLLSVIFQSINIKLGFKLTLFFPLFIASLTANKLFRSFGINKNIRILFSLFYSYNWITLSLWGTVLWLYAYASIPLVILYTYRILNYERSVTSLDFIVNSMKLVLAYTIAGIYWNLPAMALVSYFTLTIFIIYIIRCIIRKQYVKLINSSIKLSMVFILIILFNLFFIYPKITGIMFYGFKNYVEKAGYISPNLEWYNLIMPNLFKQTFDFGFISIITLPLWPINFYQFDLQNIIKLLYALTIFGILLINLNDVIKKYRYEEVIFGIISLQIFISWLILLIITSKKDIINILYGFPLISILVNVTNYLLIITPLIIIIFAIGTDYIYIKLSKVLKIITLTIVIFILIMPNMIILFKYIYKIDIENVDNIKFGTHRSNIQYIPLDVLRDIEFINDDRYRVYYRIFWLPYSPETVDLIKTSIGDAHVKGIFKNRYLSSYYETILFNIVSKQPHETTLTRSLTLLGYKYVSVLKFNISGYKMDDDTKIVYFHGLPTKIVGHPQNILMSGYISNLNSVYNTDYIILLEPSKIYNSNTPFFKLYRDDSTIINLVDKYNNNKKIAINLTIIYKNHILSETNRLTDTHTISNFAIESFIVYQKPQQLYGQLLGWMSPRILIRKDGRLLLQFKLANGTTVSHFSKFILRPNEVYHVLALYNGTHVKLFINGALDSSRKINNNSQQVIISGIFSMFEINNIYNVNAILVNPAVYIDTNINYKTILDNFQLLFFPQYANGNVKLVNYNNFDEYRILVENYENNFSILTFSMKYDEKWIAKARNNMIDTTVMLKPVKVAGWMQGFLVPPGNWTITIKYQTTFPEWILLLPTLILLILIILSYRQLYEITARVMQK